VAPIAVRTAISRLRPAPDSNRLADAEE